MKKNGLIKRIVDVIKDYNRDFSERVFLIFTMITEIAVVIALIGDIYIGESMGEIITILATIILVPVFTVICLYRDRLKLAIKVIVIGLVFGIVPSLYFFGSSSLLCISVLC